MKIILSVPGILLPIGIHAHAPSPTLKSAGHPVTSEGFGSGPPVPLGTLGTPRRWAPGLAKLKTKAWECFGCLVNGWLTLTNSPLRTMVGKGEGGSLAFLGMLIFRDYVRFTPWEFCVGWKMDVHCPLRDVVTVFFFRRKNLGWWGLFWFYTMED